MRTIKRTIQFKRDYKREKRKQHGLTLDNDLLKVIELLAMDARLPERMRDHILPDLVLIYRKTNPNILELVRLGSHGELGL